MSWVYNIGLGFFLLFSGLGLSLTLPEGCAYNKECVIELKGSICGDGTPSYFTFFPRKDSSQLVIFLEPGGACWSRETCKVTHVTHLTRKPIRKFTFPEKGLLDLNNPSLPLVNSHLVTIPYCTGDVFLGDSDTNYGTESKPEIIHHRGYRNVLLTLEAVSEIFPFPQRVVLLGRSAGALGVHGHIRNLDTFFPRSEKFALADAGTPFMPPFLDETSYLKVMRSWNAFVTLPPPPHSGETNHFGHVLRHNLVHFPHIRFGLIQSYEDAVMTYFAKSVGSPEPSKAVRNSMIKASDDFLGLDVPHAKVFFLKGNNHINTRKDLSTTRSGGVSLLNWLNGMFFYQTWENIRPDLQNQ